MGAPRPMLRQALNEPDGAGLNTMEHEGDTLGILADPVGAEDGTDVNSSVLDHTISGDPALGDSTDECVRARRVQSSGCLGFAAPGFPS